MNNRVYSKKQEKMDRATFLKLLEYGLQAKSYRFLRQSSEYWLSQFPGDLLVGLWYARGLFAEGKESEAISQITGLINLDPEFLTAYQVLAGTIKDVQSNEYIELSAYIHALGAKVRGMTTFPEWSIKLLEARQAIEQKDADKSMQLMSQVLGWGIKSPLIDVTHIRSGALSQEKITIKQLADVYLDRWGDGLQFSLFKADSMIDLGDEAGGIELLHRCASKDATGQVPERIWGKDHPYKPMWLLTLEAPFDIPVPAAVNSLLGMNQLPQPAVSDAVKLNEVSSQPTTTDDLFSIQLNLHNSGEDKSRQVQTKIPVPRSITGKSQTSQKDVKDSLTKSVEQLFDQLAIKLKQPKLSNVDGRFSTYVILSSKTALIKKYGPQTFTVLDTELQALAKAIKTQHGWDAIVFYPDDAVCAATYSTNVLDSNDPWKIKLSIEDLDKTLSTKGAMIGSLLIVGGPEVVPFHRLPNPTGDMDVDVPSDNPYCTFSSNYFVPEFPIGRLPDEKGDDSGLLLGQIRRIMQHYSAGNKKKKKSATLNKVLYSMSFLLDIIINWFKKNEQASILAKSIGYTAAIWQRSSIAVYRSLSQPQSMHVCPPVDVKTIPPDLLSNSSFEYYNLHGVENGSEWYGQRDVTTSDSGIDYPVALHPDLIKKNGRSPQVVFSEACYGGNIYGKSFSNAISLKFISIGTEIIVASTCTAYGSVSTPLIGADLLGYLFWKNIVEGYTSGEALLFAKIAFAKEMNRRQGYLDGEDQKTLLSFVLYGDPLMVRKGITSSSTKGSLRQRESVNYDVVSESNVEDKPQKISRELVSEMKSLLSPYLPGFSEEDIHIAKQTISKYDFIEQADKTEMVRKGVRNTTNVILSVNKEYRVATQIHRHYARVTMSRSGKLMKVAISR